MVSVSASGLSDLSSSLLCSTIFGSRSVNHETFRDIRSACREGGIGAADGESRTIPRYVSCFQSRTFPMYIAFWQLHSHLYLENSRVIWDSVGAEAQLVSCSSSDHRALGINKANFAIRAEAQRVSCSSS